MVIEDCKGCNLKMAGCQYHRFPQVLKDLNNCPCSICLAKLNCKVFCKDRTFWSINGFNLYLKLQRIENEKNNL